MTTSTDQVEIETQRPQSYDIVVNGRKKTVHNAEVSYETAVALAFDPAPTEPDTIFTVSYRHADVKKPDGTLIAGESVRVKNGTVFNVSATHRS